MRRYPKFLPQGYSKKKRIKKRWRRPRGIDSKLRIEEKNRGAVPKIGWSKPRKERGLHPSGLREILVYNPSEINEDLKGMVVRISSKVGNKKRSKMFEKAKMLGIKIVGRNGLNTAVE